MSLQRYLDVSQAPDADAFRRRLVAFANDMDFGLVSSLLLAEEPGQKTSKRFWVSNTPEPFVEEVFTPEDSRRDPVLQKLVRSSVPFVYDQKAYTEADAADLWDHQAQFGYRTGIAVALHLPQNRHYMIGIDRDTELPRDDHLARMMADLQLLAVHAQEAASRLFTPAKHVEPPSLNQRELEILRWTFEGKSAWSVGQILNISEHTVHFHFRSIFKKLQVANKQQAVVKALSFGLI